MSLDAAGNDITQSESSHLVNTQFSDVFSVTCNESACTTCTATTPVGKG